jgi:hypothetical protein
MSEMTMATPGFIELSLSVKQVRLLSNVSTSSKDKLMDILEDK